MTVNFEARRFEDEHQAKALADWCGGIAGIVHSYPCRMTVLPDPARRVEGSKQRADIGDWIVKRADGTVRVDGPGGGHAGYCTDCGEPVWWQDGELVNSPGVRWCYGPGRTRVSMERQHALPGMRQWIAQSRDGEVCRCLAREEPHIHQIVPAPAGTE